MGTQKLKAAKTIPSNNSAAGDNTIPEFKLYYRVITIKKHDICTNKEINRIEEQTNLNTYGHLTFGNENSNRQ